MARQTLVLDASVGVKWFSGKDEDSLPQALAIRNRHVSGDIQILVPDLFFYEVANALVYKKHIPIGEIQSALSSLFSIDLDAVAMNAELMVIAAELARKLKITIYDACYAAVSRINNIPLVTANPRHQIHALGCEVIPLEQWGKR